MSDPRDAALTVGELTNDIRALLGGTFDDVWVRGEISQPRRPGSGHVYLTLKDRDAVLPAVMWRSHAARLRIDLEDGLEVLARGAVDVYPPHGKYQFIIRHLEAVGVGALQRAFEALRRKLEAEGLFSEDRKQPLPTLPRRIGLITSRTGAAVRDMVTVIRRRYPRVAILLVSVRVQGEGSAAEIERAITWADANANLDVIIVGRGGGSIEDLWSFNEERVARAIANATTPIVSAVGHETDITIADLVADVRAATPSQAGELVVPEYDALVAHLTRERRRLDRPLRVRIERSWQRLEALGERRVLRDGASLVSPLRKQVDTLAARLRQASPAALLQRRREALTGYAARLLPPVQRAVARASDRVRAQEAALRPAALKHWVRKDQQAEHLRDRLRALSPTAVLGRGYSITFAGAQAVRTATDVSVGDTLRTRLSDGAHVQSRVESVETSEDA